MATRRTPPLEGSEERTRRRFARRQWARRWVTWRKVLAGLVVVSLVAAATWLVLFSQVLAVTEVEVEGTDLLSVGEVRRAAAIPDGEQLALVDLAAVQRRVEALAPVRSVDVARAWPDGVRIVVEEREALAVVDLGSRLRGMDRDGVVFRDYATAPADLPRVRVVGNADRDALREAAEVVSALPEDLVALVDHVEVETVDRISLVLRDRRVVVWGSADQSADKAAVLAALLEARRARTYDVSVPGQPFVSG